MNPLAQELVKEILGEDTSPKKRTVGMFAGGFKPPTLGHLEVVKLALKENPEMDELIIIVGSGTRDTITQADSLAIWNIYKKYLPSKVKVIASPNNKPPIGAIYSYARKNPNEIIYFFIGTREGNEGDLKDILIRTKSLRKLVYQNVKAKEIITSSGVSGTKARQAILNNDKETFLQFIPNIPEADEIWNMFTNVTKDNIEEYVDQQDVEDLDDLADKELNPIDVDLSGNHFFDRLNDPRNRPEIDYLELEDFFTKLGDNREKFIDFLNKYKSVVATDSETNINIPFMKMANKAIAKTVMRKRNFQTPDVKVELEETPLTDQDIIDDILSEVNNLQEVDLNKLKEKIKSYGKRGMLTLSILLSVASNLQANPGIAKDVLDTGIEMINPGQQTDFYSAVVGYTQKLLDTAVKKGDIDIVNNLKEVKLHYEALRDNKIPSPLSNKGKQAAQSVLKGLSQTSNIANYVSFGSGINTINEADPKKGTGKKPKGSGRRLYTDEDPKDTVGIKFSTRQDIVDTLNKTSFKNKSHARQSQVINLIHQRVRAAYGRSKKPEVKKRLKTALNYITKRKEASKAKTQRLKKQKKKANENVAPNHNQKSSPYGSGYKPLEEDFKPYIQSLTNYMFDNGLNLKPYPELEYIETDEKNAENIFGRTAYYMPLEQKIVLYTLDRHPKDILRSYAHELIHHHQNLNGTLNHSNTTNTNEDDNLEKIEREAYETGNIMFRNWEDQIKNNEK